MLDVVVVGWLRGELGVGPGLPGKPGLPVPGLPAEPGGKESRDEFP